MGNNFAKFFRLDALLREDVSDCQATVVSAQLQDKERAD